MRGLLHRDKGEGRSIIGGILPQSAQGMAPERPCARLGACLAGPGSGADGLVVPQLLRAHREETALTSPTGDLGQTRTTRHTRGFLPYVNSDRAFASL
jgi:hypothetical protein